MVRPWPARLRTDFWKYTGCFIADPDGADFAHCARKCGPILSAVDVGQHRRVKDDQGRVPRGLCGELNQIGAQVPAKDARPLPTGNRQRCAKVRKTIGFSWPDQASSQAIWSSS